MVSPNLVWKIEIFDLSLRRFPAYVLLQQLWAVTRSTAVPLAGSDTGASRFRAAENGAEALLFYGGWGGACDFFFWRGLTEWFVWWWKVSVVYLDSKFRVSMFDISCGFQIIFLY